MTIVFNETDDLARGCGGISSKDDHVWWIDGHDFDLVIRQSGLKSFEFWNTARSLGNSCSLVKFLGFCFLDGVSSFEIIAVMVSCISVSIRQSFHRDDSPSTA